MMGPRTADLFRQYSIAKVNLERARDMGEPDLRPYVSRVNDLLDRYEWSRSEDMRQAARERMAS